MTFGRRKIAALAAGAVAAAGIAGGAVAATNGSADQAGDLAAAINKQAGTSITADDVTGAYQDLLKTRLDAGVAAGRLTREQADQMLERAGSAPGLPGLGGPGFGRGRGGGPHAAVLDDVARKLELTEEQLRARLCAGRTLTAIATAQGVSRAELLATITSALKADGVPAARIDELAAHIADDARPEGGPGRGGPGGGPRP